jgi:DNA helicase-2/ATP-dependent DNA helicase PcrA
VKRVIADLDLDDSRFPPRQVVWWINARKDEGQRPEHIQIAGGDYLGKEMLRAYAEYEVRCRRAGLVDFAEILLRAHETLRDHAALLAHYQRRLRAARSSSWATTTRPSTAGAGPRSRTCRRCWPTTPAPAR